MDDLSKFLLRTHQPSVKTASALPISEPSYIEKLAYGMASNSNADMEYLQQFEGTPLAPQAIALAEQELAMENQTLQKQMQRSATRQAEQQSGGYEEEQNQRMALGLQKSQLMLQLYKMKATTPQQQPGDAQIGTPDPAVQQAQAQQQQAEQMQQQAQAPQGDPSQQQAEPAPEQKQAAVREYAYFMKQASNRMPVSTVSEHVARLMAKSEKSPLEHLAANMSALTRTAGPGERKGFMEQVRDASRAGAARRAASSATHEAEPALTTMRVPSMPPSVSERFKHQTPKELKQIAKDEKRTAKTVARSAKRTAKEEAKAAKMKKTSAYAAFMKQATGLTVNEVVNNLPDLRGFKSLLHTPGAAAARAAGPEAVAAAKLKGLRDSLAASRAHAAGEGFALARR